jgi:hypothetical protein
MWMLLDRMFTQLFTRAPMRYINKHKKHPIIMIILDWAEHVNGVALIYSFSK